MCDLIAPCISAKCFLVHLEFAEATTYSRCPGLEILESIFKKMVEKPNGIKFEASKKRWKDWKKKNMKKEVEKYTFKTQWLEEDQCHIAQCIEFPSLMAHGKSPEAALKEIQWVVHETLVWMKKEGEKIPEPLSLKKFSGRYPLRISPELHRELALRAAEQGVSLNQYIQIKLAS